MKFNLQINPEWKVVDVRSGMQVPRVLWVDDETHEVAQCKCAMICDRNPDVPGMLGYGKVTGKEVYEHCAEREKYVHSMPKVKLDEPRKCVLVNVDDAIKPEETSDEAGPVIRRAIVILA